MIFFRYCERTFKFIVFFLITTVLWFWNLSSSRASSWTVVPVIEIQEVFTDNVSLVPSGLREEEFITVITPGISLGHKSNRTRIELDYSLQNILYANDGDRNSEFHLLRVDSTSEILEDRFFLDLSLNRSTQNINNTGNTASDNLSVSGDRANVLSYKVSPYWRQRFGSFMDIDIRYTRDDLDSSRLTGSNADDFKVNLTSGSDFSRLLWDIKFNSHEIDNDSGVSSRVRNVRSKVRYLFSRKLAVIGNVGYDNNRFESSSGDISGISWNFGAKWNPSPRTSLEATYGRRFFGDDLQLQLSHRSRRSQTLISFEKVPSTTRATLLEQQVFNLTDPFGEPLVGSGANEIATINVNVPIQSTEVLIRSRLTGVFSYNLRKHTLNLSTSYEELDYQLSGDTEFSRNVNVAWIWNIFPRTSATLNLGWSKENRRGNRDDRYLTGQLQLTHILSPGFEASIGARYIDRDSNDNLRKFDESRLFANINKTF